MPPTAPLPPLAVAIRHADRFVCKPAWNIKPYVPGYNGLFFIRTGLAWVTLGDTRYEARPRDLFFLRSWHQLAAGHDPDNPITCLSIGFTLDDPTGRDMLAPLPLPTRIHLSAGDDRAVERAFLRVIKPFHAAGFIPSLTARAELLRLVDLAIDVARRTPEARSTAVVAHQTMRDPRIELVHKHIVAHVHRSLTLDDLAAAADLSRSHLVTLFRQTTGKSPMDYLRQLRVDLAKRHLAEGKLTITQIARRVGFDDPFHFSRVFRRIVGVSPKTYAASARHPFFS